MEVNFDSAAIRELGQWFTLGMFIIGAWIFACVLCHGLLARERRESAALKNEIKGG